MYYLQLEYDNTIISIPFGKLMDIDNYTMQFRDRLVFLDRIISILGIDIDKNAIQRIECGKRFVTDIEIIAFAKVFGVEVQKLLD